MNKAQPLCVQSLTPEALDHLYQLVIDRGRDAHAPTIDRVTEQGMVDISHAAADPSTPAPTYATSANSSNP